MERACFLLKVKKDRIKEYEERHQTVWPEMLEALRRTGWHNYSLFLRPDGLLVGYVEAESFDAALRKMQDYPVNARWQQEMAEFFEGSEEGHADERMTPLKEVFHLD
jgi:L-rhamnose mutarotase